MRFRFKKRLKYNKKQAFNTIFLFLLVIGVTLGFALLTTKLKVSGTSQVSASTWDVHFENIQAKSGSVTATSDPVISNDTEINFSAELPEAGEFYGFTVDVVNDGTYDAKLDEIQISPELTSAQQEYFSYTVTYSDGVEIKKDDALASGSTETVLVNFEYKVNADTSKYPTEDVDFDCSVTMYYVQGEGNEVVHPSFSNDSWATIVSNVHNGAIPSYYSLGSTKEIDMGTLGTHTLRIVNNTTPSECNTEGFSHSACGFVLEFADIITTNKMNSSGSSADGWGGSEMRTYVNSTIYNALPTEIKTAVIDTYVVFTAYDNSLNLIFTSSTDKMYLLSKVEVYNTNNNYNTRQLDFYSSNGVTTSNNIALAIKKYNGSASYWWLRDAGIGNGRATEFNFVTMNGGLINSEAESNLGVSPAFRIG